MNEILARCAVSLVLATMVGCMGAAPPSPVVTVTSPKRGLVAAAAGQIMVTGNAQPAADGSPVAKVTVNGQPATLAADGSFTALVDLPAGAMLLETTAVSEEGGSGTDARAVEVGELRPVGTGIDRAVTAALSADAFAKLSAATSAILKTTDLAALLAPMQPMANLGDDLANLKLSITKLSIGDVKIALTPTDAGLAISVEIDGLDAGADVAYAGSLVPDGTTSVTVKSAQVTIAGTLNVTPAGTAGFTTKIASPVVNTSGLQLNANGLIGQILTLLNDNLASTVQSLIASTAESALEPLMNDALGALTGPKQLDVLGHQVTVQASPSELSFTNAGALVTLNLQANIAGSESSPGFLYTPDGTPTLDVSNGIQLALADNLLNEMLAEIHAAGLLDLHLAGNFDVFDSADIKLSMPPMINANTGDGSMRLVLGDMIATFSNQGQVVLSAAINAEVELAILRGTDAQQIAIKFGKVDLFVNILDDASGAGEGADLSGAANQGIAIQLDSLSQFLVTVPVPSVAGVSLDSLSLRGDSGYVVVAGQIH
jgi:hypothetical protein